MMSANEIRTKFLDFFKSRKHTIVASDSLVPKDDPTVLFTTAGMQQFKRQFLGHIDGYTRAASSQKCLRTDDLDKIGKTPCHHTFFEMLGNFSFGDYFKKDAIAYAWEFLTKEMKLPAEKLWVSVYEEDQEAYDEWVKMGFPKERIVKLGDKDNFWPAEAKAKGPNGPCGPCSEIFYDYGKGVISDCKNKKCDPSCSCGRFTEVWNLVFTQFNRKEGGILEPLPNKNIDTGMGFERLVAVVQGKKNNYETDLFQPILKEINNNIKGITKEETYVIADHIRATVFAISDGVIPSNKERGSVVKNLINNATNTALSNGAEGPSIYKLVPVVSEIMLGPYPEIKKKAENIASLIKNTEQAFIKVLSKRLPELKELIKRTNNSSLRGRAYFEFHDTYGLPPSTIRAAARECGLSENNIFEDFQRYQAHMEARKEESRQSSKMTGERFADIELDLVGVPKTKFTGYDHFKGHGKLVKLFVDDTEVNQVSAGDHVKVVLDQTPFYAEAGGQVGDTGYLTNNHGKIRIVDTQKQDDIYIHFGKMEEGELKLHENVEAVIDEERRWSIMRNHTATHLLQSALRETLGAHVQQQGSLVAEDRLRFDFTHPKAVSKEELEKIESTVTGHIKNNDKVNKEEMSLEEAKKKGALAFFAEKYKDRVRVISAGDYSKEFCGGTHLDSTGEIKQFVISAESAVAQGIRRLEAKTGDFAAQYIKEREAKNLEQKQAEEKRLQELREKKEADKRRLESFRSDLKTIIGNAETVNDTKVITCSFTGSDTKQLKDFSDLVKQQVPSVAVCLGTASNGSTAVVLGVSGDLVKKGIKANELIQEIAALIKGSGGGRPELAQAGSKEAISLENVLNQALQLIKVRVQS